MEITETISRLQNDDLPMLYKTLIDILRPLKGFDNNIGEYFFDEFGSSYMYAFNNRKYLYVGGYLLQATNENKKEGYSLQVKRNATGSLVVNCQAKCGVTTGIVEMDSKGCFKQIYAVTTKDGIITRTDQYDNGIQKVIQYLEFGVEKVTRLAKDNSIIDEVTKKNEQVIKKIQNTCENTIIMEWLENGTEEVTKYDKEGILIDNTIKKDGVLINEIKREGDLYRGRKINEDESVSETIFFGKNINEHFNRLITKEKITKKDDKILFYNKSIFITDDEILYMRLEGSLAYFYLYNVINGSYNLLDGFEISEDSEFSLATEENIGSIVDCRLEKRKAAIIKERKNSKNAGKRKAFK